MKSRFLSIFLASSIMLSGSSVFAEETTETTTETTTEQSIDTDNMSNMMEQMDESFGKDITTYDTSDLSVSGGNHGGTTMTLSEFQTMMNDNSETMTIDNDTVFNYMKNSLDVGEDISLSSAFSSSTGLEIPSNLMYDLSDCGLTGTVDASSINLQYADLTTNLSDTFNTASLDLSSKTVNATTLFENTYGDLASELQVEKATLPSDFNFSSLSAQNQSSINEAYNSAFSNSDYNSIKNKVSTSSVFEEASKGLTMPDLLDFDDLNNLTKDYKSELEADWSSTAADSRSDTWATYQNNLSKLDDYDDEKSLVTNEQEEAKNKISQIDEENADLRYKAETTSGNYIGKKIDDMGGYDWVDPFYEWVNGDAQENSDKYNEEALEREGIYYDEDTQRYYKKDSTTESTTQQKTTEATTQNKSKYIDNSKETNDEAKDIYGRKYIN